MKREDLEKLGLSKEQIDAIMAEHGKTVETHKKALESANAKVAEIQSKYDDMNHEYDEFKKSKMTEDEKKEAEAKKQKTEQEKILAAARDAEEKYNKLIKESKVKEVLISAGITSERADTLVSRCLGETVEDSVNNANMFVDFIKNERETAKTAAIEEATKKTPKPENTPGNEPKEPFIPEQVW